MSIRNISQSNIASKTLRSNPSNTWILSGGSDTTAGPVVWQWSNTTGFGTRYVPTTTPGGDGSTFHPQGTAVATGSNTSPYIRAWPFTSSGFGTIFSNPGTTPTHWCRDIRFSPSGNTIIAGGGSPGSTTTQYLFAYPWSISGWGTRYANPGTLPGGWVHCVKFNASSTIVFTTCDVSPFVNAYAWTDGVGWGTKFANPSSSPSGTYSRTVSVNTAENAVAMNTGVSPFVYVYAWNNTTGWGTRYSNPSSTPSLADDGLDFAPDDASIAMSGNTGTAPTVQAYAWTNASGFGTKYSNPATNIAYPVYLVYSNDGSVVFASVSLSPGIYAYRWTNASGFGTLYSNPSVTQSSSYSCDPATF